MSIVHSIIVVAACVATTYFLPSSSLVLFLLAGAALYVVRNGYVGPPPDERLIRLGLRRPLPSGVIGGFERTSLVALGAIVVLALVSPVRWYGSLEPTVMDRISGSNDWQHIKRNWLQMVNMAGSTFSADHDEHGEGVVKTLDNSKGYDRCHATVVTLEKYFCSGVREKHLQFADQDALEALSKMFTLSSSSVWRVNIFQGDPNRFDPFRDSLGHVFCLHFHWNRTVDLYQSFIDQYNVKTHMDIQETRGLHPMNQEKFGKDVLSNLETLLDAEEWTLKANAAYLRLFHVDPNALASAIDASSVSTRRFHIIASLSCVLEPPKFAGWRSKKEKNLQQ